MWNIDETEAWLKASLPEHFHYGEEADHRFLSDKRRKEWLTARVLLHTVAGVKERLDYSDSGRPFLTGSSTHLSISHSGNYVCLLLSDSPAGIDLEQKSPRALRVKEKFLKEQEMALADGLGFAEEETAVLLWSAKEAIFKRMDAPTLSLLQDITFYDFQKTDTKAHTGTLQAKVRIGENPALETVNLGFLVTPDFVLTVCK